MNPMDTRIARKTCAFLALLLLAAGHTATAAEPVFLAVLEADAELETAFPGEVIETLWRAAELRTRRCRVGASDPAWLARIEEIAADPQVAREVAATGRTYLLEGALNNLAGAGLDPILLEAFRLRAADTNLELVDLASCNGFVSTLQQIYDRSEVGDATPAVVGTVCGQVDLLVACHSQMPEPAARLRDSGD